MAERNLRKIYAQHNPLIQAALRAGIFPLIGIIGAVVAVALGWRP